MQIFKPRMNRFRSYYCKSVRSGKPLVPISQFEKLYLECYEFKKRFKVNKVGIIDELIRLSNKYYEPSEQFSRTMPYEKRRAKKHSTTKPCFCCGGRAYYQHHIISLKNNGYDNGINRISICDECHSKIHPWLQKEGK